MKILGRIKKSKVLTGGHDRSAHLPIGLPHRLAYAAEQARSSAVLTVTASVDDLDETLPTLKSPTDFTAGSAIGTCPAFWVANDDGTSYVEALMAKKQKQGLALNWYDEDTGAKFDWYKTKVTKSTSVIGKWEKYDVSVTFSANDGTTKSDTETVPYGQSYKQAFGKEKAAPATRKGYEFDGWYDSSTNKKFDFTKKLTDPTVSVYAKWNLKDAVEVAPTDASRPRRPRPARAPSTARGSVLPSSGVPSHASISRTSPASLPRFHERRTMRGLRRGEPLSRWPSHGKLSGHPRLVR